MKTLTLLLTLAVFFLPETGSFAVEEEKPALPTYPFKSGERLVYDISWERFLTAGEGILKVDDGEAILEKNPRFRFEISGRTTGFIGSIYKVADRTVAWFDKSESLAEKCEITIRENKYRKKKSITFDREENMATYVIDEREPEFYKITESAQGPVSALYLFRMMKAQLLEGKRAFVPLFDDRKMYDLNITVLGKERLNLPFGAVDTIKTVADLKTEGVFRRKGEMTVWFSDDATFAPVQMRSKIMIGSIYATLREYRGADINVIPAQVMR